MHDKTQKIPSLEDLVDNSNTEFNEVDVSKESIQPGTCVTSDNGETYNLLADLKKKETTWTFLAERKSDRLRVVLDIFFLDASQAKLDQKRLLSDAQTFIELDHPNIVNGLDFHFSGDAIYYVTQYIESVPLLKHLKREGKPASLEVAQTLRELSSALDYIGKRKLIHGNITPASLVVPTEGQVRLSSFQLVHAGKFDDIGEDPPYHLSPEQLQGTKLDNRADIYCMGATFFFLLTGTPPFKFTPLKERLKVVPDPVQRNHNIEPHLGGIIMKMMEPKPRDRYQDGAELAEDLDYVIGLMKKNG